MKTFKQWLEVQVSGLGTPLTAAGDTARKEADKSLQKLKTVVGRNPESAKIVADLSQTLNRDPGDASNSSDVMNVAKKLMPKQPGIR